MKTKITLIKKVSLLLAGCLLFGSIAVSIGAEDRDVNFETLKKEGLTFQRQEEIGDNAFGIYEDAVGNEFRYDARGKLVGCSLYGSNPVRNHTGDTAQLMNQAAAANIDLYENACTLAGQFLDITPYKFTEESFSESFDSHMFVFHKVVDGYKTGDFFFINTSSDGTLLSFSAPNQHKFDDVTSIPVELSQIESALRAQLAAHYPDKTISILTMKEGDVIVAEISPSAVTFQVGAEVSFAGSNSPSSISSWFPSLSHKR